jgi:hypothetical protein
MGTTKIYASLIGYLLLCGLHASASRCVVNRLAESIGQTETTGRNDGPWVDRALVAAGFKPNSRLSYCGAYILEAFKHCGLTQHGTAWSPSWFPKSRKCLGSDLKDSSLFVFGLFYKNLGRLGHVGYVLRSTRTYIITLEGNTSSGAPPGSAQDRDGGGFWSKRRMKKGITHYANWKQR